MMRLPSFRFVAARSVAEAAARLADAPEDTRLVAGGPDLAPTLTRRHQQAKTLVSLRGIDGLRGRTDGQGTIRLGAMTTLTDIVRDRTLHAVFPGFVRAVASISSPVLRNMGTIGGNLCLDTRCTYYNQNEEWRQAIGYCMKEVGETCWVAPSSPRCWAVSSSDSAPILSAIDARARLVSTRGERELPLRDLFKDDGIHYLAKRRDEVLVDLTLPKVPGLRTTYWKLRRRGSIDFPVLGVAAALRIDRGGTIESAALWLGAVASRPIPCPEAEAFLVGKKASEEIFAEAARLARDPATPLDNTDFTLQWRRDVIPAYVDGALRELAGLPERTVRPPHGTWVDAGLLV